MSGSDPDDPRFRDTVVGSAQVPPPEPWFIQQLRERAAASKAPPPQPPSDSPDLRIRPEAVRPIDEFVLRAGDAVRPAAAIPRPGYRRPHRIGWWPIAAGAALAAVIALALWVTAPPRVGAGSGKPAAAAVAPAVRRAAATPAAPAPLADPNAALQCARPETIARLRALVAEKARAGGGGARSDRLAELVSLSVTGTPDTGTPDGASFRCSGWLSLAAAGVGVAEPVSVTYRVERTADGRSLVSILEGTTPIVAAIIAAAQRVDPSATLAAVGPSPAVRAASRDDGFADNAAPRRFSNPSFNCRRATSQVNRMICASDALAALDRETAALFVTVRDRADPHIRDALEDSRVDFLNRRQRCSSEACIARVYEDRIADLEDYR